MYLLKAVIINDKRFLQEKEMVEENLWNEGTRQLILNLSSLIFRREDRKVEIILSHLPAVNWLSTSVKTAERTTNCFIC